VSSTAQPSRRYAIARCAKRFVLQEECGIDVVTDGEVRRTTWTHPLTAGLGGFGRSEQIGLFSGSGSWRSIMPALTGPVRPGRNLALQEVSFARDCTATPIKPTLPSPSYALQLYVPDVSVAAYPSSTFRMSPSRRTPHARSTWRRSCR
jgi:5-methyltetrahydropteroyltriglutamate--homocysteine methyltransferase